jgi:hypothetical protein
MMLPVIRHRAGKILAVVLALAGWLGGGYWFQAHLLEQRIWWHLSGIAIFFMLAVFLPEERKARSLGRKGALQMMAFVIWLLATDCVIHFKEAQGAGVALGLLLGAPVLSYFAGLFMIRGFRALPEYGAEVEMKSGEAEPTASVAEEKTEEKGEDKGDADSSISAHGRAEELLEKLEEPAKV